MRVCTWGTLIYSDEIVAINSDRKLVSSKTAFWSWLIDKAPGEALCSVLLHLWVLRPGELQQPDFKNLGVFRCAAEFKGLVKVCGLVWLRAMLFPPIVVAPALMTHTCTCCYLISRQSYLKTGAAGPNPGSITTKGMMYLKHLSVKLRQFVNTERTLLSGAAKRGCSFPPLKIHTALLSCRLL